MGYRGFILSEDGAVTVEWVTLAATAITVALSMATTIGNGSLQLAGTIASDLSGYESTGDLLGTAGGNDAAAADDSDDADDGTRGRDRERDRTGPAWGRFLRSGTSGNPGNDKDVGRAGENPSGRDGQGSRSH